MGARMDPWGTPQDKEATSQAESPILTFKQRFVKYDMNQSNADPLSLHSAPGVIAKSSGQKCQKQQSGRVTTI